MRSDKKKTTTSALSFVRALSQRGFRIFKMETAHAVASKLGIHTNYVKEFLFHLRQENWIHSIKRGLYSLDTLFLDGVPLHEFEIAMAIAPRGIISFYSAFRYHELTLQVPSVIYVTIPSSHKPPQTGTAPGVVLEGIRYEFVQTKKDFFFGHQKVWLHNSQILLTDLERTLIDGLRKPHYCGSFIEVMNSYHRAIDRIDIKKIIDYGLRLEIATSKRLGYVLEKCGVQEKSLQPLIDTKASSFFKLDNQGPDFGPYNRKWMIRENA